MVSLLARIKGNEQTPVTIENFNGGLRSEIDSETYQKKCICEGLLHEMQLCKNDNEIATKINIVSEYIFSIGLLSDEETNNLNMDLIELVRRADSSDPNFYNEFKRILRRHLGIVI